MKKIISFCAAAALALNAVSAVPAFAETTQMPAFSLPASDGTTVRSQDIKGKLSVFVMSGPECGNCRYLMSSLREAEWFTKADLCCIVALFTTEQETAQAYYEEFENPHLRVCYGGEIPYFAGKFLSGSFATPFVMIVTPESEIVYQHTGFLEPERFHDEILPYLGGNTPQRGDFDGNGSVSGSDAQKVLVTAAEYLVGNEPDLTHWQKNIADVDSSGEITPLDAQFVLQYFLNESVLENPVTWEELIGAE